MIRIEKYRTDLLLALAAALIAVVLVAIGFGRAWPLRLDVGAGDARFVSGFNAVETTGGTFYRWTNGNATIAMPHLPTGAAAIMSIRLLNGRPSGQPDLNMQLSAAGQSLGAIRLAPSESRIYHMVVAPDAQLSWATTIGLKSDTILLPSDPRPLGGGVDWVSLTLLPAWFVLPSAWLALWSAALGALGYTLLRGVGRGRKVSLAGAIVLAGLVAFGIATRPLEVLPFVLRIAILLGMGCLCIGVARLLAPPITTKDEGRTTKDRVLSHRNSSSFIVRRSSFVKGADLPIYLALAWWMGPLFQIVMTADGARSVIPPDTTSWIGGALLLGLAVLAGWYVLLGRKLPLEQRSPAVTRAALALVAVAAFAHLIYMIWFAFQRQGPDFWILFMGARDWARGGSLYDLSAIIENHFGHVFKVPPFYGMLFLPFVFQDGERILFFHRVINVILLSATAIVWFRMCNLRLFSAAGAGVLILLNFRPITDTMAFGQIDLALLLALTLAIWVLRSNRAALDVLAGALVALGTLFKVYPVLLLAFFVVKRRWWAVAGFALGMLVLNGLSIAVIGWEMHRVYLFEVLPRIGGTTSWVENQTISGFLARLFAPPTDSSIFHNRPIELLGLAIGAAAGLLACVLSLRPTRSASTSFALQYSLFALVMVLTVPAAWMHYETLLFLPFALLLLHARDREIGLTTVAALALSFALVGYGNQWSYYDGTIMGVLTILGVSYKFYGMLLLGGVLTSTLLAERAPVWADLKQAIPWRRSSTSEQSASAG